MNPKVFIKFFTEEPVSKLTTLNKVETDQFFIDSEDRLCQKCNYEDYVIIANSDGRPCCQIKSAYKNEMFVKRILPEVTKIEF